LGKALESHSKATKQRFWGDASEAILASRKNRPVVNLATISKNSKEGAQVVVPGKVLGGGSIDHKVRVAAHSFSQSAKSKIIAAGGECLGLEDYMEKSKDNKGVLVLG
jgi:large subunit ribosomal protein L18e